MDHEFFDTVNTSSAAQILSQNKVLSSSSPYIGFTIEMNGRTLLEQAQNVKVLQPRYHINGSYTIMDIVHQIDFVNSNFKTIIDFERPGYRFSNMVKRLRRAEADLNSLRNISLYRSLGNTAAGLESSLGAYV